MKYPKIKSLVPQGEHFDESAIVNEGGYISVAHLDALEKTLGENATAISGHAAALQTANDATTAAEAKVTPLTEEIATLKNEKLALEQKNADLKEKNKKLKAKNEELGGQSSDEGGGTPLPTSAAAEIKKEETGKKPGLMDANHPANLQAAAYLQRQKAKSKTK